MMYVPRSAPADSSDMPKPPARLLAVRVWDLPTRLFHWVLALTVAGSFASAYVGGNAMAWHFRCGYVVFTLLIFRLLWGLVGGRWSRFGRFIYAPGTLWRYLRGRQRADEHLDVGHSPLGGLSVFALLLLLAAQVATGLVADDEIAATGPLNRFVGHALAGRATFWHADVGQWALLALVALHLLAIAYYRWRKRLKLVRAMLVGDKMLPPGTPASLDSGGTRIVALVLLAACAALVSWVVSLGE